MRFESHDPNEGRKMTDAKAVRSKLRRELETLRAVREELDLQATRARAEAHPPPWAELDSELNLAQEEIDRLDEHSEHAFRDLERTRVRLDRMNAHFEELRRRR
jgi:hypothetical protein